VNDTTTLADHVREILLAAGFNGTDGGITGIRFRITEGDGVTVGTEGDVPDSVRRAMLGQYAATLREAGLIVADHSARYRRRLHVRESGPAHGVDMARATARILARGYTEHVRLHGPDGDGGPVTMTFETEAGGGFTVEREGHLYDVTVTPRAEG
jgi:hypothetical protein